MQTRDSDNSSLIACQNLLSLLCPVSNNESNSAGLSINKQRQTRSSECEVTHRDLRLAFQVSQLSNLPRLMSKAYRMNFSISFSSLEENHRRGSSDSSGFEQSHLPFALSFSQPQQYWLLASIERHVYSFERNEKPQQLTICCSDTHYNTNNSPCLHQTPAVMSPNENGTFSGEYLHHSTQDKH